MGRFLSLAVFTVLAIASPAQAADVVVIASTVPAYKAGQVIDSGAALDIPAGQKLTCVSGSGKSVTRTGPYKGPVWDTTPPATDKRFIDAMASLASGPAKGGTTLGAVRSAPKAEPEDPWVIDVGRAGDQCVVSATPARLWRADGQRAGVLSLSGLKDEGTARVEWPAGQPTLGWPEPVKLADGAVYMARLDASPSARRIVLHVVPGDLLSDAHRAVWMAAHGCQAQGRLLLWGMAGE